MDDIIEILVPPKETQTPPKKTLTPKRPKLSNQERLEREREREEKAKQKQEEKERKLQERLKKEQEKRQQEEEQRLVREQREKERLEKLQRKQEEKDRKLQERLDKENAKKQIEQKQNRVSEKFKQFFVAKSAHDLNASANGNENGNGNGTGNEIMDGERKQSTQTFFKPFVLKNGMKLAPIHRYFWSSFQKDQFWKLVNNCDFVVSDQYLVEMKLNKAKGCNYSPISSHSQMDVCSNDIEIINTNENNDADDEDDDDDDDDDDDENIVRIIDRSKKCEKVVKPKLIQFHDNRRPAYFGTFQKKSKIVNGRRPYRCDRDLFDYEFDSDLEWCEEDEEVAGCGGGEQLRESDHEDDDEEVASGAAGAHGAANDDYEVDNDFFVPHGYLSEDEEMNADENEKVTKEKLEELEKEFVSEIKSETKKLKPTLCGLFWQDATAFSDPDTAPRIPKTLLKNRIAFDQELIKSIPILASFPKT